MYKKILLLVIAICSFHLLKAAAPELAGGDYAIVVEGFDWGPAVNKVILTLDAAVKAVDMKNYTVSAERKSDCAAIAPGDASGSRTVVFAYVSDAGGNRMAEGNHVALVLAVGPDLSIGSPIQYSQNAGCRGNTWIDYRLTVTDKEGHQWNRETNRIIPLVDKFDLSGRFKYDDMIISYAAYTPTNAGDKYPLIIWLHGGGEGGTDPSIPLIANRAANYASDEIQTLFGGAYVLSPQSPTYWMDSGDGMTTGKVNDRYNEALMALFKEFVAAHPAIDPDRIYVGGCSNGGYMTLKLILLHPDFFAAAFPSALAYEAKYLTDDQVNSLRDFPIWFVQSKDDPVTVPNMTVIPVYQRLKAAGATNLHFSFFDHVIDLTGFYGGKDYHYNGHWSWIYCHANQCRMDIGGFPVMVDGRPVTIMEWLAAQRR
ncbi:MAG TPA: prolyl oligopeptidase family serine peptidase [Flavilitoribacter sp.]|nr:prolyl oligopeptidase family serine peptidase [Flavilitoribacter sp.]HMQ88941.1 prolyl oligopeptidase family serine peptidase [Flavilitoribacter sp.]